MKHCLYIKNATKQGYLEARNGDSVNLEQLNSKTRRGRVGYGVSQTLTTSCNQGVVLPGSCGINFGSKGKIQYENDCCDTLQVAMGNGWGNVPLINNLRIRKLTPKECWRLMGFDDEDFEKAKYYSKEESEKILKEYPKHNGKRIFSHEERIERMSNTQLYKQAGNSIVVNVLEAIFKELLDENEHIRLLELFGGIGACTKALKRIGIDVEVVDSVEIDKYAVKSYNAMNGTNFEPQDITIWDKDIKVDLLCGGFPCQDISLAGKQKGIVKGETRSGLMYEMMRIIEKTKPKYVIAENVKNLLSDRFRPQLEEYLCFLNDNGYKVTMDLLNSKDYSIPQNRERIFIVGVRDV